MIQEVTPKDPHTTEVFNWDFEPLMVPGDTVASVIGVEFPETDGALATVGAPAVSDSGFVVSQKLGPCTSGQYYTARCRVLTTPAGETLDLSLRFYCEEQ
jgi:hypothetical protein